MRVIFNLVLVILLGSCTSSWHFRRALKKDPSIMQDTILHKVDTTFVDRVVNVEGVSMDTVLITQYLRDTIELEKEKIKLRYIPVSDTSGRFEIDCPEAEVVVKDKIIERDKVVKVRVDPTFSEALVVIWDKVKWFLIGAVVLGIALAVKKRL